MIKVEGLDFAYGKETILDNVSLTVESGTVNGLLGPNGAGKTTLLALLSGLKKPDRGMITVGGHVPFERKASFLSNICYLPDTLSPSSMTASRWAERNGIFRPDYSGVIFSDIMDEFKTDKNKKMDCMSYGQLKKTQIAFALASRPRYLFLDEPTNGLDTASKKQFIKIVGEFRDRNSCVVIATHQPNEFEGLLGQFILIDGKKAESRLFV